MHATRSICCHPPKPLLPTWVPGAMQLTIDSPCDEPWDSMEPRSGGRFCQRCQHTVLDLSKMTRAQAERVIRATPEGERICINMAVDPLDAPIFRPEPRRARHFVGGLVLVAALTAGGCGASHGEDSREPPQIAHLEPEPPGVVGIPMTPVDTNAPSPVTQPEIVTGPVFVEQSTGSAEPTAEQLALSRRKQTSRTQPTPPPPPPIRHIRGGMRRPSPNTLF